MADSAADLKISFSPGWWLRLSPRLQRAARRTRRPSQAVLAAAVLHQSQTDVAPELAPGAEAVGGLQRGDQQGHAQRTEARDLAQACG